MEGARGNASNTHFSVAILLELFIDFYFLPRTICSFLAHFILFTFQRRPSLDLYCFSYDFPKQVTFVKVIAGMKGCEVAPLQLLKVHILQKLYRGLLPFALT